MDDGTLARSRCNRLRPLLSLSLSGGIDAVVLACPDDVDGLLATSLGLLFEHFAQLARVHLVTPDVAAVRGLIERLPDDRRACVHVWSDAQVCPEAIHLPPWFRQQYLKLHADRLAAGPRLVVLSGDTLILDPMAESDLLDRQGRPLVRYFRSDRPDLHLQFERRRVRNVARLLGVEPQRALLFGDLVCDLFLFDVALLQALRRHLALRGGLLRALESLGPRRGADDRFGEWTAYAVFCLELAGIPMTARRAEPDFFGQLHSPWEMRRPDRYRQRIVHFAWKPIDVAVVLQDLSRVGRLPAVPA